MALEQADQFYYVNFEDDRFLGFEADDANDFYQILVEVFGERNIFIIDEVQNITGWVHFVRRFMDIPRCATQETAINTSHRLPALRGKTPQEFSAKEHRSLNTFCSHRC